MDKIFFVDALEGAILFSYDACSGGNIISGTVTGKTRNDIGQISNKNFRNEYVYAKVGATTVGQGTTASNGSYSIDVGSYTSVTVKFNLEGPWVKVTDAGIDIYETKNTPAPASNVNYYWKYLDDVLPGANVFYHTNKMRDFFLNLGYNDWNSQRYSSIEPTQVDAGLSDGIKTMFSLVGAKCSDAIYHETTHPVIYTIFGDFITGINQYYPEAGRSGNEGEAMNEAFPDFFACTVNGNSTVFDLLDIRREIGPNKMFSEDMYPNEYQSSLIMSGACWDLRTYMGTSTANQLLFDALNMMATVFSHPYYFGQYLDCVYICNDVPKYEYKIDNAFVRDHGIVRMVSKRAVFPDEDFDEPEKVELPQKYLLYQNFPNPFNSQTLIRYEIPPSNIILPSNVRLRIYNLQGQLVKKLVDKNQEPGKYQITWQGNDDGGSAVASGIYLLSMKTEEFCSWKKLTLIR